MVGSTTPELSRPCEAGPSLVCTQRCVIDGAKYQASLWNSRRSPCCHSRHLLLCPCHYPCHDNYRLLDDILSRNIDDKRYFYVDSARKQVTKKATQSFGQNLPSVLLAACVYVGVKKLLTETWGADHTLIGEGTNVWVVHTWWRQPVWGYTHLRWFSCYVRELVWTVISVWHFTLSFTFVIYYTVCALF